MAARRLLIVMLILLGISTLAAALVPQSTLNDDATTTRSTTTQAQATTAPEPPAGRSIAVPFTVRPKQPPVQVGAVCEKGKSKCQPPLQVGDRLTLLISSKPAAQLEFPEFGQFQFAAPNAPARFEVLPTTPGSFGILFASTDRVAARVRVLSAAAARKQGKSSAKGKGGGKRSKGLSR
jgi:hypothetical protein